MCVATGNHDLVESTEGGDEGDSSAMSVCLNDTGVCVGKVDESKAELFSCSSCLAGVWRIGWDALS